MGTKDRIEKLEQQLTTREVEVINRLVQKLADSFHAVNSIADPEQRQAAFADRCDDILAAFYLEQGIEFSP